MRRRARLVWRLFGLFTVIVCGTLVAAGWYFSHELDAFFENEVAVELTARTRLVQALVAPHLAPLNAAAVDDLCKRSGADSNTRYTVILPSGVVVGDTWENPANMDNHAARPEVAGALARGAESSRRFSATLQRNVLYVATAIHDQGRPVAVVRAAIPLSRVEEELARVRSRFIGIGALIAGLALAVTLALSQRYGRKVRELQEAAARLAEGDLSQRLPAPDSEELAGLAESFNRMAAQIESRMQEVVRQRNQLEGVLSSMQEGVIAVDPEERVLSLNPAAARWFDLPLERARGRSLQEVVRNLAIQKFVARSLKSREPAEEDMAVFQNGERILNVRSTPLQGAGSGTFGSLIVFNDVTQLRRLEDMRRDFVANVSHELKTPLTAIKGFVETLHQGQADPEEARRFLGIIAKHVDRLNVIIEDLLMLSRIEDESERAEIKRDVRPAPRRLRQRRPDLPPGGGGEGDPHPGRRRRSAHRLGRPGAPGAGRGQPARQRREVQRPRARGRDLRPGRRARDPDPRAGPGGGDRAAAPAAALRALLPGGQGAQPRRGRHGAGAGDRQAHRPGARRARERGKHGGRRQPIHDPPAAGLENRRVGP